MGKKLRRFFRKKKRPEISFEKVSVMPTELKKKHVYLIHNEGYCWEGVLLCPCGCGVELHVNFLKEMYPYWTYSILRKGISLHPSIHRIEGCKSHFFIRCGKLKWVGND
jgi:hypothetical protein